MIHWKSIEKIETTDRENDIFQNRFYTEITDAMFSISLDPIVHVKVQFEDVFQIRQKLSHLKINRPNSVITYEDDKLIYEDDISGIYDFCIKEGKLLPLRLDRIRSYEISEEKIVNDDLSPLELIPQIWGMEVGEPVHVKIKILNEARVQEKVKRDLASRTKGVWSQKGDSLYFEDDVIGINNFRTWLHGYGSSVLVIKPRSLREQIIESARKRVAYYE